MAQSDVNLIIAGDASSAIDALNRTQRKVEEAARGMQSSFESLGNGLGGVFDEIGASIGKIGTILGAGAIYEGLSRIREIVISLGDRAIQMRSMADVLGVNVTQFQAMKLAADEAGVGQEQLFRATEKLSQALSQARAGSGSAITTLRGLGVTTAEISDKNYTLVTLLTQLSARLNDSSTASQTLSALAKELGTRGALAAEAIKNLSANSGEWEARAREINALTDEQAKKVSEVAGAWRKAGDYLENYWSKILVVLHDYNNMKPLFAADHGPKGQGSATGMINYGGQSQEMVRTATQAEMQITASVLENLQFQIRAEKQGSEQRLSLLREYAASAKEFYGSDQVKEVREANLQVVEEERAVNAQRERLAKEHLRAEQERVRAIEQMEQQSTAVVLSITAEKNRIRQSELKLEEIANTTRERLAKLDLQNSIAVLREKYSAGLISMSQELAAERDFENKAYAIELQGLRDRLALVGLDEVERARTLADIELLEKEHQNRLTLIAAKGTVDRLAPLRDFFKGMTQGWEQGLSQIIGGQLRLADGIRGALQSIGRAFDDMIAQTILAMAKGLAMQAIFHKKGVLNDAYKAASGAYSATAEIPIIGPVLAPIAAIAAFGATAAFGNSIASARSGFDVPAGVNPLTQLHEREMVLPADIAERMRAGTGSGSVGRDVHMHVHAVDARGVKQFLIDNRDAVGDAIRMHFREFGQIRQ